MDATDEQILSHLSENARLPFRELGRRVGLSSNAAAARVRRMEADGTIAAFTVRRGPAAGPQSPTRHGLEVFIDVRLRDGYGNDEATRALARFAEIVDAAHVTGSYDYLVHAVVPDAVGLDAFVRRLKAEAGVGQTSTRLALRAPRA